MKRKILIGSIFAALLMLSMPFVSTVQAPSSSRSVQASIGSTIVQPPADLDPSTLSIEDMIEALSANIDYSALSVEDVIASLQTVQQIYGNDPEVAAMCTQAIGMMMFPLGTDCEGLLAWLNYWHDFTLIYWGACLATGDPVVCAAAILLSIIFNIVKSLYEEDCGPYPGGIIAPAAASTSIAGVSAPAATTVGAGGCPCMQ